MSELTRRGFVTKSAGAAASAAALGTLMTASAEAEAHDRARKTEHHPVGSDPVVAFVADPRKGEVSLMAGERRVTVRDRRLAAQLSRAARSA
jgi:hypothetical protein